MMHFTKIVVLTSLLGIITLIAWFFLSLVDELIDSRIIAYDQISVEESNQYLKQFRGEAFRSWIIPVFIYIVAACYLTWTIGGSVIAILRALLPKIPIRFYFD